MYRLVLVGDEAALAATAEEVRRAGAAAVAVVGLDFEACDEAAAGAAVDTAWRCFGDGLDALVNCCSYEGMCILTLSNACLVQVFRIIDDSSALL